MNYCEKCNVATEQAVCPLCGSRKVRQAQDDDFCLLTESKGQNCEGLIAAFEEEGVPYSAVPYGSGVETKFGMPLKNCRLYVPFSSLETAKSIAAEMERAVTDDLRCELLENAAALNFSRRVEKKARKKLKLSEEQSFSGYCVEVIKSAEEIEDGGAITGSFGHGHYIFCYFGKITLAVDSATYEVLSLTVSK